MQRDTVAIMSLVSLPETFESEALQSLQSLRSVLRPPLSVYLQLRGVEESCLVLHVCDVDCH